MSNGRQEVARAFGLALKAAREAKSLSQEQLAEGAELDRSTPSLYERGLRQPTLTVLIDIGRALNMEPAQLIAATIEKLRADTSLPFQ